MDLQKWWTDHQEDVANANTWVHKYAFPLLVIVTLCLLLSLCSNAKHAMFGHREQSVVMPEAVSINACYDERWKKYAVPVLDQRPAVMRVAYAVGRPDGGPSFFVPLDNAGETRLVDMALDGTRVVGSVYNDPETFSTIVKIGDIQVGVKPDERD